MVRQQLQQATVDLPGAVNFVVLMQQRTEVR
jgi:hypothetical protein